MNAKKGDNLKLSELKFTINIFLSWTGKGFVFGLRDLLIPDEYIENDMPIANEHFTVNLQALLNEDNIENLSLEDILSRISFHRTENKCKNDQRDRTERGSNDVTLIDIVEEFRKNIPPQLIDNKDHKYDLGFNDIAPLMNCWEDVLTRGERSFLKKDDPLIEEEEEYIPDISLKDYEEKMTLKFEDFVSFKVEEKKPGKKWNIAITFDLEIFFKYIWEFLQICDIPDIDGLSWEKFKEAIDSNEEE